MGEQDDINHIRICYIFDKIERNANGNLFLHFYFLNKNISVRGLPLIMYIIRGGGGGGGGGVITNAYKCVQGGRGGLYMTNNRHFVRRFIENATTYETLNHNDWHYF